MKRLKATLLMTAVILALAGCDVSTRFNNIPQYIAAEVLEPCADPVLLEERDLRPNEVEIGWTTDRVELIDCKSRHAEAVQIIKERLKVNAKSAENKPLP